MVTIRSKRQGIVVVVMLAGVATLLGAWQLIAAQPRSPVRQIYVALNPTQSSGDSHFWIRVTEQPDEQGPTFVGGAYYTFYSGRSENGPWKPIIAVHLDDPDPIPTRNVVFVDANLAYVFLYDRLAVTKDAGRSWSLWEPGRASSDWGARKSMIEDIVLSTDGSGTMHLRLFAAQKQLTLGTRDFGESWHPQP